MDNDSLPPLPSVQELFAPSSSQSSSLPFLKNVNLFIPVPPLPETSNADVPPIPQKSPSQEYTGPYSPVPPQPTSPLVDRFDYQLEDNKSNDSVFQPERNKCSEVISSQELLSGPPCKKARYSETASLQYDSREEGEISDDADDADQTVISGRPAASQHKPQSSHFSVSRNEHMLHSSGHRRLPSNPHQNFPRTSLSGHRHHSNTADTMGRSSHHRHRVHPSVPRSEGASNSEGGHHQKVAAANAYRSERSLSSHKQPATHSDGHKVLDDSSRPSRHHRKSHDSAAGTESAKYELQPLSRNDGHKSSRYDHRNQSSSGTAATETAKHKSSHSLHHHHHRRLDLSVSKGSDEDGSRMSNRPLSFSDGSGTTKKDALETGSSHQPSAGMDHVHHRDLSSGVSQSSRLHHILAGSTLGSEIVKNMSLSSTGQQVLQAKIVNTAVSSVAKNATQSLSLQPQLTDSVAANETTSQLAESSCQQSSLNSDKESGNESQYQSNCHSSSHQYDALKQIKTSQLLRHQQNVMHGFAVGETTEKLSSQPQIHERCSNSAGAGNCQTTDVKYMNAEHLSQSRSERLPSQHVSIPHIPHPPISTTSAGNQHSSTNSQTLCSQKDLDAPYSPGSLDLDDFFEPTVASDPQEGVSCDYGTSSNTDTVSAPCPVVESGAGQNVEITTSTNVEDSVMEIDTADLVDELPAAEELEELSAIEGRGQEYEIIDDLDSNADEVDHDAAASSENSEVEFDSGEHENSPCKQVKKQHSQRVRERHEAAEEMHNNLEPFDAEGGEDFQAPLVHHKIVLRGESKSDV